MGALNVVPLFSIFAKINLVYLTLLATLHF